MELLLVDHVCLTRVAGHLILLDLRKSRYHAAPSPFSEVLEAAASGDGARFVGTPEADRLIRKDWLRFGSTDATIHAAWLEPARADWNNPQGRFSRVSPPLFTTALALQFASICRLKLYSLEKIVTALRETKAALKSNDWFDEEEINALLSSFEATRRVIGERDRCLMKSIALFRLLVSRGVSVDLVIGVRLAPFSAHCWVQKDGNVLNDRFERVRLFTPIVRV